MKILLFGKTGQVGWELQRSLAVLGQVVAPDTRSQELCGDFLNLEGIAETIRAVAPDIIINAAAHTAVDRAESEPEVARHINASAPAILAREARHCDALLVHYSTDYVFDGSGDRPWTEADVPSPLNVYGMTKLEAEQAILASGCRHLIFRTSWVYAARGNNFVKTILRLAQERDQLQVIDDQIGAPTGAELIADVTAHAILFSLTGQKAEGLYHLVARGETSWHGLAHFVISHARNAGIEIKTRPDAIHPVPSSAFPRQARRPGNSRMHTGKLERTFGLNLPHWQTGVARALDEMLGHGNI
jgi:dTDP-4-dehydrorhamnose reductase